MKCIRLFNVLYCSTVILSSCSDKDTIIPFGSRKLESRLQKCEQSIANLEANIKELRFDELLRKISDNNVVFIEPGSQGYSPIKFDLGVLTVSLDDVKAYANGSKVSLRFGNPLSSTINGLKLTIDWGTLDANGQPQKEKEKTKDITLAESLREGAWTSVAVVLDGVPPSEFGYLRLKNITHQGISLARK